MEGLVNIFSTLDELEADLIIGLLADKRNKEYKRRSW